MFALYSRSIFKNREVLKTKFCLVLALSLTVRCLQAQYGHNGGQGLDKASFGTGLGFDYGGIGANILVYPIRNFGLFAGAGYAFAGAGFNGGAKIRFWARSTSNFHPYLIGMYGYNTAVVASNGSQYSKFFYGTTWGIGVDCRSIGRNNYWSFALLIPVRSPEVDKYIKPLKLSNPILPFGVSIGYHFAGSYNPK